MLLDDLFFLFFFRRQATNPTATNILSLCLSHVCLSLNEKKQQQTKILCAHFIFKLQLPHMAKTLMFYTSRHFNIIQ